MIAMLKGFAAMIGAMGVIVAPIWAFLIYTHTTPALIRDVEQVQTQLEQISKSELQLWVNFLLEKQKRGGLTTDEQLQLCHAGQTLGYPPSMLPGCQ